MYIGVPALKGSPVKGARFISGILHVNRKAEGF